MFGNPPEYQINRSGDGLIVARTYHGNHASDIAHGLSLLPYYHDQTLTVIRSDGGKQETVLRVRNGQVLPARL